MLLSIIRVHVLVVSRTGEHDYFCHAYDTIQYGDINVHPKAGMYQLNLPHGNRKNKRMMKN